MIINTEDLTKETTDFIKKNDFLLNDPDITHLSQFIIKEDCIKILMQIFDCAFDDAQLLYSSAFYSSSVSIGYRQDSKVNQRPGYHWVNDPEDKGGGYWRKNPPKSAREISKTINIHATKKEKDKKEKDKKEKDKKEKDKKEKDKKEKDNSRFHTSSGSVQSYSQIQVSSDFDPKAKKIISLGTKEAGFLIDNVHKKHSDFPVNEIAKMSKEDEKTSWARVEFQAKTYNSDDNTVGMQYLQCTFSEKAALRSLKNNGENYTKLEMTASAIHEYGHALDYTLSKNQNRFGSIVNTLNATKDKLESVANSEEPEFANVMNALRQSTSAQKLKEIQSNISNPDVSKHYEYLLRDEELFARGYTQYIAEKNNRQDLVDHITMNVGYKSLGLDYGEHWNSEEFKNDIMPHYDELLKNKNLL